MRKEYDFTDSVRNPYAKHFRKQVTMRLGTDVIEYFKALSVETGVPYQTLINLYLRDCAHSGKNPRLPNMTAKVVLPFMREDLLNGCLS